jgi:hypothetical protein
LSGFTLIFREAYFDNTHFQDLCYANISPALQQQFKFAAGDEVEFSATPKMNRGRIILTGLRKIEISNRGGQRPWTHSDALVVKQTATILAIQPAGCLACAHGVLVDVYEEENNKRPNYRELFCLKGVREPGLCTFKLPVENPDTEKRCP